MPRRPPGVLAERRAAVLSQLVLLFAQGGDPVELAEDAVNLVARATDTAAVFVYLWDPDEERLVLRVATAVPQQVGIDGIRLRLGDGIAGWAALRQQSVIIGRHPREDPRYLGFDEIDEEEFNSVLAVPIADEHNQLRGVFALYSREEEAFGDDELSIAVEVGRLLATGLVRAETVEDLNRQSASARFLLDFPTASRTSLVPSLQFAAGRILDLLDADFCVLEYMSRRESGAAPIVFASRSEHDDHRVWSTHSRTAAPSIVEQHGAGLEHASVSLGMGASRGILSCYRRTRLRAADLERMSVLAMQLGVLLEAVDLNSIGSSLATRLRFTPDDAEATRILEELGVDGPVCPVLVRVHAVRGDGEVASRALKNALETATGSRALVLLHSTWGMLLAEAPTGRLPAELGAQLLSAAQRLADEVGMSASIGIGSVALSGRHIRRSMAHAQAALDWAGSHAQAAPVTLATHADIRDLLPLVDVVRELTPDVDRVVRELEPLVRYDIEQGSQLVRTLAVLAECGGSVNTTALRLVIHRNTLRQRMQRIGQVVGMSLEADTDWTALTLAARVAATRVDQARGQKTTRTRAGSASGQ